MALGISADCRGPVRHKRRLWRRTSSLDTCSAVCQFTWEADLVGFRDWLIDFLKWFHPKTNNFFLSLVTEVLASIGHRKILFSFNYFFPPTMSSWSKSFPKIFSSSFSCTFRPNLLVFHISSHPTRDSDYFEGQSGSARTNYTISRSVANYCIFLW